MHTWWVRPLELVLCADCREGVACWLARGHEEERLIRRRREQRTEELETWPAVLGQKRQCEEGVLNSTLRAVPHAEMPLHKHCPVHCSENTPLPCFNYSNPDEYWV
ncbi:E3 ubiquitin-protein ligase SMURF2 [Platysternon megacephalum]|uniref:E3 ubiquitin-protein ligase SMURF2 n=1 Tax=Platysternon megacephalum TaxID=55544 RepID=A0A4D9EDL6_9SAUR|nr:E3 ubiquitin-protein ligase SMURF2 [Platysternon megacephalum]